MMIHIANPIYDSVFKDMNVEDEFFQAIENRDTAIMMRDKLIAEKDTQIAEKDTQIAEQNTLLRSMIHTMISSGMKLEDVAHSTGLSLDKIHELLKQ